MGNEASLEGGEGPLSGLPEGLAPDGAGGFVRVPGGAPVDLAELSEEQRKQLAAVMSRAQGRQPGGSAAARRGPTGLSKSRTVDAFNQSPLGRPSTGRSPSSLNLFESRFRQEPKDPESKPSGMFGSSFLSGANPLSAVSSMTSSVSSSISSMGDAVNIPKFGLFGDEEEGATPEARPTGKQQAKGPQQGSGPKGPQQGAPQNQGQGPPGQGPKQGKGPQGQGPKSAQGPPGQAPRQGHGQPGQGPPEKQGPRQGQGPPAQQGPKQSQGPPSQQGPRQDQEPPDQQRPKQSQGTPSQQVQRQGQGLPGQQGPRQGQGSPDQQGPRQGQGPPGQQGPKQSQGPPSQQGPRQGQEPPGQHGPKQSQGPPSQQGQRQGQDLPGQQGPRQGQGPPGQQGPRQGQGPPGQQGPRQGQGPPGQQGPRQGQGPPGPGAKQTQGGPPQPKEPAKPGPNQQGSAGSGAHPGKPARNPQGPGNPGGGLCPLCKTTQLNTGSKDPPNYNNCTECKNQVCSLCGFSPPDSAGKEWLCLNCQMQRAMGGMDPPGIMKPKQGSAPPSPQKQAAGKPGKLLIKQQSTTEHGLTPPTTPRQKSPSSPGPLSPGSSLGGSPKIDPKTGRPIQQKSSPQQSPAKAKQESSFFGGFGGISFGGLSDSAKPTAASSQAAESVTGKLFGGFGGLMESAKPQAAPKQEESVTGKLFGGFGGLSEAAKPPAAASQMFTFGSSLLNTATSLVTGEEEKAADSPPGSPADSGPGSLPDSPFSGPGSPPDSDSAPDTPPAKSKKAQRTLSVEREAADKTPETKENCPLCSVELNVGSSEAPNFNLCTECKKIVCNLCGFNPTPHLGEKEWLCLNCQTRRANQLDDVLPLATTSPKKLPPPITPDPSSTSAPAAVVSKPVVEDQTPPAPETKVEATPSLILHDHNKPLSVNQEKILDRSLSAEADISEAVASIVPKVKEQQQPGSDIEKSDAKKNTAKAIPVVEKSNSNSDIAVPVDKYKTQNDIETAAAEGNPSSPEQVMENFSEVPDSSINEATTPTNVEKDTNLSIGQSDLTSSETNQLEPPQLDSKTTKQLQNEVLDLSEVPPIDESTPQNQMVDSALNVDSTNITQKSEAESVDNTGELSAEPEPTVETPPSKEDAPVDFLANAPLLAKTEPAKHEMQETESDPSKHIESISNQAETSQADQLGFVEKQQEPENKLLAVSQNETTAVENAPLTIAADPEVSVQGGAEKLAELETVMDTIIVMQETESDPSKHIKSINNQAETSQADQLGFLEKQQEPKNKLLPVSQNDTTAVENTSLTIAADPEVSVQGGAEKLAELETVMDTFIEETNTKKETSERKNEKPAVEIKCDDFAEVNKKNVLETAGEEKADQISSVEQTDKIKAIEQKLLNELGSAETVPGNNNIDTQNEPELQEVEQETNHKLPSAQESFVQTASPPETSTETEKDGNVLLKEHDDYKKAVVPNSKDCEKVRTKQLIQSEILVSPSAAISQMQVSNKTLKEKVIPDTNSIGENVTQCHKEALDIVEKHSAFESDANKNSVGSLPATSDIQESISVSEASVVGAKDGTAEIGAGNNVTSQNNKVLDEGVENSNASILVDSAPVAKPHIVDFVDCEQNTEDASSMEKKVGQTELQGKQCEEDAMHEVKKIGTLKEPAERERATSECSATSPSDLAKLESTVLPILEAQAKGGNQTDTLKTRRKLDVLPLSPDSPCSEDDRELGKTNAKKKLLVPLDVKVDSLDDSSESFGKESPISGDDEDFIRKQIIEMSENEDASPSDEENPIKQKIREDERKKVERKKTAPLERSASGKAKRLTKKNSVCPNDDEDEELQSSPKKAEVVEAAEIKEEEFHPATAVRLFPTMELNTSSSPVCITNVELDLEMECLTDSPDDRSKGEGSSSLHASSFTPGTSPTSVSSLEEDSDSSSPSYVRSGESRQHRKAKHRQPGQMLPTIEDSSEEEEMREEEELLREQEKQRGSGKKSKKDKEEVRGQRRRDRSKTPPSNLSPIEDASPTEELRQEAEMEEIRRSSCSDFSPSIESDPEGFEIHAAKIAAVQKTYKLPMSVSLHSPTEVLNTDKTKKTLRSADEAYEEILLRAKSPTVENIELQPGKESLYGGLLIEDYVFVENSTGDVGETEKMNVPAEPKKLRSPDEVYEDMMKKRKEFMKLEQEYHNMQPQIGSTNPEIVLQPADNTSSNISQVTLGKDEKPLLDADTAYEELMKKVLTPGTSPTLQESEMDATSSRRALYPIPDLRVTQCSSGELSSDEESIIKKEEVKSDMTVETTTAPSDEQTHPPVTASQTDIVDLSSPIPMILDPVTASVTTLPTVPQYAQGTPSIITTAPPVPPKPNVLRRASSQEKADVEPPLPPPTPQKPTVFPRKPPVPLPPQASATQARPETATTTSQAKQSFTPTYKPHVPPPVPPKPSIPSGIGEGTRPIHVKPPIAPKPSSQPPSPALGPHPPRPTMLTTCSSDIALNLSPSSESKQSQPSPKSPTSPRYTRNLRDTYVVITLPSQPSSPVDGISTQAPSDPGPASPSNQAQHQSDHQTQAQSQQSPPPHTTRMPLAYTRVIESIESQEICSPEKHVSSSCHIIEAVTASAQLPVVMPNLISQLVTTELQRTTVSVVHERTPPPVPAPRANGVPISLEKHKTPLLAQNGQIVLPADVVDLRTMKVDAESDMSGVDLSSGPDSRRQSFAADASRQSSAVQSPVVNLSTESSTVSIMTDSITIVTCAATIQKCDNLETSKASSIPLQLTKNKVFEPVSQIVYRSVDSQPPAHSGEIPINLTVGSSTGGGTFQTQPVFSELNSIAGCVANGLTAGTTSIAGAVDLSTAKPFNTVVSMDSVSTEVVTAVIAEEDGKPVDLTAGKRAVCCDVVYKLPFAGSCTAQQPTTPLPEDRFGYRDDHYQYDRSPYGMRGFGGIKPSMSDTNLAEAGLFFYKSKNSYNFSGTTDGAVDLSSTKMSDAGEAVDYSKKGIYAGMTIPPYSQARVTSGVGTLFGTSSVLRSSNGVVYSSVAAPIPSTYAITTQPGSIFCTSYNSQSSIHTSDTMPSLSNLQNLPLTRSHSFLSTVSITTATEQGDTPLNLELTSVNSVTKATTSLTLDTYTDASLEAIAASLEALSSPMVPGDGQYQAERERLEMEKLKQQRLAEELEWERHEIQRFREQEQLLVQKELEELQVMKQQILTQQEDERQAHLMMQKETYAQQQQQLEQIQRLQEQLRMQLEEQKLRQMYPGGDMLGNGIQEAVVLGPDGTVLSRKITDSGCQTDEEDETLNKAYTSGRKKKSIKKSVDSCVQTDDEDQEEWESQRSRQNRPRTARGDRAGQSEISLQAHTEISIQTDTDGNIIMDTRMELSDSERTSPKKKLTPLEIGLSNLKAESSMLQAPPKSPNVLYSPLSPCISPSKSLEFVSYDKSLGDKSPQKLKGSIDPLNVSPGSPRGPKPMQRSMSDPKPMSPTGEDRITSGNQYSETERGSVGTPTGTQKKVKRTLPNPPSDDESTASGQTAYSTGSARRRMCRNSNMARAKILQDIDRELNMVERESSKLRKKQAELDEEEKEIDAKLRYLEMGINRRKDVLLKEREKRERAYLQSVAEDRDYMSDSEVSNIREARGAHGDGEDEELDTHGLERPRTAPQSELDDFVPPQTKHEYGKYTQYQYSQGQFQQSLYQTPQSYQSHSIYSSVPSLTSSQQQSYHQMLLLQQKAARQAALLSELDATKYDVISRQPDPTSSSYLGVKYDKYGNHLDLRALEVGSIAGSPMSTVSDSYYSDLDHHTPRSYLLLEDAAELAKSSTGLSASYSLAERELAKAEKLLQRSAADLGSTDYLGSSSRLHTYGKTPDEDDPMEEPYELKLLKQQLKQEFRRSTSGTESLDPLTGLSQHYYTPSSGVSSYSQRHYPKTDKYSISRLTLEKQAAKQLPASMLYQKHKTPLLEPNTSTKYSITESRGLDMDYTSYLGSTSGSPRSSRLMQDEITFGLRKNIAEQQKYLGSTLGANLAGSLNLGQSMGLDSAYPSGSRSRPSSRPTSCYGLDLSIKRDPSSSSLRLKGDGEASSEGPSFQTPSGRTKPTSLPIVQSGRGRIPIVAQNSEEESPLSPVGQPMGMARASAGPLPPISADSRDQFGSCLSLQDSQQQQQHMREEASRGRGYVLLDDLQGTMSDSEALSDSLMPLSRDDAAKAYHLRREETDWFDKPRDGRSDNGQEKRQGKGPYYPFSHLRVKLQRDPKDRSVSGNGLGIRVVGGKEVPGSNGEIGAYVAKVLPGGAAEQTGKNLEGMQVLEWNGVILTGKTYEEVQGLVGHSCSEAEMCVRLDLNMLAEFEGSEHLDFQEHSKTERPPRSPGVDPKQLAAELQKVSQQQAPSSSATSSPAHPGSPSVSKKRHSSKAADGNKTPSHPITGDIQLQIHYDKQMGNLIVHVLQARNLAPRDNNGYSDPFVKVYLLPGRGQVMVVQNASAENKRRSKHAGKSLNPEWNQTVIYKNIHLEQLRKKTLEVSVWDYDKCSSNDFLGEVLIDLSDTAQLDNVPHWLPLKPQTESDHHRRSHQSRHSSSKASSQHSSPKTAGSAPDQDSPKSSVIKSRSHGIFPDPAKDMQVPPLEKSRSSPATSKPSPSEGQSQSPRHGHAQHSHSRTAKGAAWQRHQEGPQQRLQPSKPRRQRPGHHRHSVEGVLTIQRAQSDWLPALPSLAPANGSRADSRPPTLRKAVSEERPTVARARSSYRSGDGPVTAASLDSGLSGSAYSLLDEDAELNEVDSAIFQVPRLGKIPNGTDGMKSSMIDSDGKSQVMGEIKIALKKDVRTEGDQLVLEILQCRNITYKFKTADHLPDLYVKLYVVNIATQKRIIKKKTRVCRHDREPSFNETFRFCMNPAGHSLQLFLVSNGGKFMKKTLIGEAYVWLDKVDLRKRVVSWHKLLASTAQIHS
ncbi:protein piccolo [Nerophis ophidion]|uniref:protein piccolo n=1 Tax=Nerophis ophidion TaxID=159077 RepID=UPI002ADF67A5|nr:protein piccolo [Nerophis ophidion]